MKYLFTLYRKKYNIASFTYKKTQYASVLWSGAELELVSLTPPLESKDGEYRGYTVTYTHFDKIYSEHDYSDIEMALLADLDIQIYSTHGDELPEIIENNRVALKTLVWVLSHYNALPLRRYTNLPDGYNSVLSATIKTHNIPQLIPRELTIDGRSIGGIKLSLLSLQEAADQLNIEHPVWKEIALMQWASDTVINRRCISFPLLGDSAFIAGNIHNIVISNSLNSRFNADAVARRAVAALDESRQLMNDDTARFRYWDRKIFETIQIAEREHLLSDNAIISIMTHVGVPWGSDSSELEQEIARSSSNKIIFDVCYASFVLHDVAIHGDLHVNNLTALYCIPKNQTDSHIYILTDKGEKDTFVISLPSSAGHTTGFIIDFSQSIVIDPTKLGSVTPELYYKSQLTQVLRVLRRWMPKFVDSHQEEISGVVLTDMGRLAKALVFVDYYAIGQSAQYKYPGDLAERITKTAREVLTRNLLIAIGKLDEEMTTEVEFFHKVFSEYEYRKHKQQSSIRSIVAAPEPMLYSGKKYSMFPPWGKLTEMEKHSDLSRMELVHRPDDPYEDESFRGPANEVDKLAAEVAKARLRDGPPVKVGVTWF